jgi:hypothetical protein
MAATVQVENVGERLVIGWLAERGYSTNLDTSIPGSTDIEARGRQVNLLIQVRTAESPNTPSPMTPDEERILKSRAGRLGFEPWEARVQLNQHLQQVGDIQWRKLT